MGHYIINFTVYTLAMSGLIFFALFVYKKVMSGSFYSKKSKFLDIEETLNVNPRKSILVVRAGNERFLIASDIDKTTFLAKLDETNKDNFVKNIVENPEKIEEVKTVTPETKALDLIYPKDEKQPIHLELIKNNNPNFQRLRRKSHTKGMSMENLVTIDVSEPKDHGLPTIQEIAQKINEL